MSEFESFVVYEGKGIQLTGWMFGEKLRLDLDATEPYFASIVHYELNEEDTHRLMSILGYEEFAGLFENGGKKWLEDFFEENGLSRTCTYYGINEIDQRFLRKVHSTSHSMRMTADLTVMIMSILFTLIGRTQNC